MRKTTPLQRFLALFALFLALYGLTAQRGLGWGDSGEFQYRILHCPDGLLAGCDSFATAHPLYVALARLFCRTPFHVTLLSSFFGALAVGGFFLCTRKAGLTILFGLSHMLWRLSCMAEVQTLNLAFTVFETFCLLRFLSTAQGRWMHAAAFLAGLHLSCHNFALLAFPVYACVLFRAGLKTALVSILFGAIGGAYWFHSLATRGFMDVLVGSYGSQVAGLCPSSPLVAGFNLALAALSFAVPAALAWTLRPNAETKGGDRTVRIVLWGLFGINALFFVRYFVPDQATFLLPTLFFAYLLVARGEIRVQRLFTLILVQLLLPIMAGTALSHLPAPAGRARHKYRDDAAYFAFPWKFNDTSADRLAAEREGPWNGYPQDPAR
ncbi:MAG: protein O-mannosyl-transferase family [Kiritimatiellia bacterium]